MRQTGKYLVQHVYERACQGRTASQVIVATDDPRILAAVQSFGGAVVMTRRDHPSGTDRVAEVAGSLDADVIVNLQGDEPLVDPAALDLLPALLESPSAGRDGDACRPDHLRRAMAQSELRESGLRCRRAVLYFSRSPIPFVRDGQPNFTADPPRFLQHLGLYAYRRDFLLKLAALPPEPLEQLEKLEQLRVLALGHRISVGVVHQAAIGVDTYEDYQHFVHVYRQGQMGRAA